MLSTRLFYAVSAPQSCFGYYYAFWAFLCFLKTPLSSMRACDGLLKLRNIYRTGNQIKHKPMPLHTFAHSDSHTLIRKFFLPIKRMGSIRKKWKFWDSNSGLPGYEPGVLTAELNFLSRSKPGMQIFELLLLLLRFFATSRNKGQSTSIYEEAHPGRLKPL